MTNTPEKSEISFTRDEADLLKFSQVAQKPFMRGRLGFVVAAVVLALLVAEAVLPLLRGTVLWQMGSAIQTLVVLIVYLAAFLLLFKTFQRFGKQSWIDENGNFVTPKTLSVTKDGIRETSDHLEATAAWPGVLDIRREGGYTMAFIDKMQAFVIPDSAFESEDDAEAFYRQMLEYWKAANPEATGAGEQETSDDETTAA